MMRTILAVVLPALFLVACLSEPKHGCRTTDDCASGRVCVVGTCQPERRDAGRESLNEGIGEDCAFMLINKRA